MLFIEDVINFINLLLMTLNKKWNKSWLKLSISIMMILYLMIQNKTNKKIFNKKIFNKKTFNKIRRV